MDTPTCENVLYETMALLPYENPQSGKTGRRKEASRVRGHQQQRPVETGPGIRHTMRSNPPQADYLKEQGLVSVIELWVAFHYPNG